MYLVIDTATSRLGLALLDDSELVGEVTWHTRQNHTAELVPTLEYLLDRAKVELHSLKGIIVAKGPGSFTGLRVGITTAKGLAMSTEAPLVGVSTLEAWAHPYVGTGLPVCAVQEAGRGQVAAAIFQWSNDHTERILSEHITNAEEICRHIRRPTILCGEMSDSTRTALKESLDDNALMTDTRGLTHRAAVLGQLGRLKIERDELDDPPTLQPLYLRRPSITKPSKSKKGTA
ncbi:MAG: tRNA (adenosine(37)-N6)-threonylcarbamoyltransferase complex dimerization subunit type 1 TsaB [Dehalococcoidia bacterium]